MLTQYKIHKAGRIDQVIRDFFNDNSSINEVQAKELMVLFISKNLFNKNHRDGLPIRSFLRELDKENRLDLIQNCKVIRNIKNRNWYFIRNS